MEWKVGNCCEFLSGNINRVDVVPKWRGGCEARMYIFSTQGNNVVKVIVEEELGHLSCGAAIAIAIGFIEPAFAADAVKSIGD